MEEQTARIKRGPGRPRKPGPAEAAPAPQPASAKPTMLDINGIAKALGRSRSTVRRIINADIESPPPFKLSGYDFWLAEDLYEYLRAKARKAKEERERALKALRRA